GTSEPDPVVAAALAEFSGAEGIIVHLREDSRHIQKRDLVLLKKTVKTKLNLEMAATEEMIKIAKEIKPDIATLVPEKREELTTEEGLDVNSKTGYLANVIKDLKDSGIKVSLFINPDPIQIKTAKDLDADYIEIHTGFFCDNYHNERGEIELERIKDAVKLASRLNLAINAGHGINYNNIRPLLTIKEIEEFSIGHSIIARALIVGIERAVREMYEIVNRGF
ncbi:MAG: pyridoxine 5'-phosphate synthase, partial [Thermodesulfobacteriota bacterium]|nr:pyridoxine 5'-phosphate synthase [Thermodesulfobacteriota bacterium]